MCTRNYFFCYENKEILNYLHCVNTPAGCPQVSRICYINLFFHKLWREEQIKGLAHILYHYIFS